MQTLKKKGGDNSSYSLEKTLVLKSLIPLSLVGLPSYISAFVPF